MSLRRSRGGSRPRNFLRVCLALVARMCLTLVVLVASAPSNAGRVERGTDARIRLNTVGFIPGQEKRASVAARFTDFNVVSEARTKRGARGVGKYQYPFQNPALPAEERITNLLSLMTLEEKVACLGTNPSVPRLGVKGAGQMEGLHGLAVGGPAKWGRDHTVMTTTFPQAYGLGETWDADVLRRSAAAEGFEARYIFQSERYGGGRTGLVIRAPNADLWRDPRWGRTEECYGEDPYLTGTLAVSFIKGLQGDDPRYWRAAALMKHFLANSNENGRGPGRRAG